MVDIPFVSEDFQRAYRNRFPSQTQTGRDLHVSDVVIPVVDFTPSATATSLPEFLQLSQSNNNTNFDISGTSTDDIATTPGFYSVDYSLSAKVTVSSGITQPTYAMQIVDLAGTATQIIFCRAPYINVYNNYFDSSNLVVFFPVAYKLQFTTFQPSDTETRAIINLFQIADVNGNLTTPSGFFPQ